MTDTLINRIHPDQRPVTLEEAKKQIRVTHDLEDSLILSYIDSAIEYCEDYTNTRIQLSLVKSYFDHECWSLTRPVRAISSINYIDANGDKQQINRVTYTTKYDHGVIIELDLMPDSNEIWVEYITGYGDYTPGIGETVVNETIRPMPSTLKHCILLLLSFDYINRSSKTDFQKYDTKRVDEMLDQHVVYE